VPVDPISLANLVATFPYLGPIVFTSLVVAIVVSGILTLYDLPHVFSKSYGIPAESVVGWLSKIARCYISHVRKHARLFAFFGVAVAMAFVALVGMGFVGHGYLPIDQSNVPAIQPTDFFNTLRLSGRGLAMLIFIALALSAIVCFISALITFVYLARDIYNSSYSTVCAIQQHYRASRDALSNDTA
jgi:hypothetical protein